MSKRSGFLVKITAFIDADPNDIMSMSGASDAILALGHAIKEHHMQQLNIDSRFMLSREVPDAPKPVEAPLFPPAYESVSVTADGKFAHGAEMPPIPAPLRRP